MYLVSFVSFRKLMSVVPDYAVNGFGERNIDVDEGIKNYKMAITD